MYNFTTSKTYWQKTMKNNLACCLRASFVFSFWNKNSTHALCVQVLFLFLFLFLHYAQFEVSLFVQNWRCPRFVLINRSSPLLQESPESLIFSEISTILPFHFSFVRGHASISMNISRFRNFPRSISRTAFVRRIRLCVQLPDFMHAKNFLHAKIRPGYFSGRIQKSYYLLSSVFSGFRCDHCKINP